MKKTNKKFIIFLHGRIRVSKKSLLNFIVKAMNGVSVVV